METARSILKTEYAFFLSFVIFTGLLFLLPTSFISQEHGGTILTITTFLFGIVGGFYIVVTTTDYNNMKDALAAETGEWISLYKHVLFHNERVAEKMSDLIDQYIRRNFDYEIIDSVHVTHGEFDAIALEVGRLSQGSGPSWTLENIQETMADIIKTRQQLTVLGTKTLSIFQWFVLYILGGLVVFSLYGLRTGELFFDVVTVAVSCAVVLIFFLVRDLDLYRWNERTFGFDIFENVLRGIGKLPYYPGEAIESGRVHPREKEYRIGILTGGGNFERTIEVRTVE